MTAFHYQRGETISLALDAISGDPALVTSVSALLKAVPPGRSSVPEGAAAAAVFSVATRLAQGDNPPGWTLSLAAESSALLSPGIYLADARLAVGTGVIVTEPVTIRIRPSVSA